MMAERRQSFLYILSNRRNGTLYTGVTSNLTRRLWEHREGKTEGFSKRYGLKRLVYFEAFDSITAAIAREKQVKKYSRARKLALIEAENPHWKDLAADWFE